MSDVVGWRTAGRFAAWVVATTLSAGLVWLGLTPVLRTAVPDRVEAHALEQSSLGRPPVARTPTPSPSVSPTATSVPSVTPSGGRSAAPPAGRPSPTPSRSTARPEPSTVDGWTVVEEPDGSSSYLRHFVVDGGETTIRMTPGRVELVSATPRPGYTYETLQAEPQRLVVRFYRPGEAHLVDAIWWEGRPYAEVTTVG